MCGRWCASRCEGITVGTTPTHPMRIRRLPAVTRTPLWVVFLLLELISLSAAGADGVWQRDSGGNWSDGAN